MVTPASSAFRPRDVVLLVSLALLWGNSFLFIKIAVAAVPPPWIVTLRMTLGACLLFAIAAFRRSSGRLDRQALWNLALIGALGGALPWLGQAWAQQYLDSGLVAVLNACTPVTTLLLAVSFRQERLYRNRVLGLSLAVLGSLVVVGGEVGAGRSPLALLVAVLSTTGYALGGVLTRARVTGRVSNLHAAAAQLALGAVFLAPLAFAVRGAPPFPLEPKVAGALLALGLFGTGLAFLIYFSLIENVGATNASMVTYVVPIIGLMSGAVFRGERFGANVFVGAAGLILGIWLSQRQPSITPPA